MKLNVSLNILILILAVSTAEAKMSASTSAVGQNKTNIAIPKKPEEKLFSSIISLSSSSNMYKEESPDRESSVDLLLLPSLKISQDASLTLKTIATQTAKQDEKVSFSNTSLTLGLAGPKWEHRNLSTGFSFAGIAPTNTESREKDSFRGGASLGTKLVWAPAPVTLAYAIAGTRNFHEYTLSSEGSPNIQYSVTQSLNAELTLGQWGLSAEGLYRYSWTYRNFSRQSYASSFGISYAFNDSWSVSTGVENSLGPLFKANGRDTNIRVFDQNQSQINLGLTFTN
ncbi:MAG: hypothetical protein AB7O96_17655 [Pseudobdellovibrionaceae bacterium]